VLGLSLGLVLRKFDRGDRPLSIVPPDRDSKAVQFVEPDPIHRSGLSIGEDHGLADKLGLRLLERTEDGGCTDLRRWHGNPESDVEGPVSAFERRASRDRRAANGCQRPVDWTRGLAVACKAKHDARGRC
jgi:hypothetical protein